MTEDKMLVNETFRNLFLLLLHNDLPYSLRYSVLSSLKQKTSHLVQHAALQLQTAKK